MADRRWLPENVTEYRDRHGKPRYRFRRAGLPTYHFKGAPGSDEFLAELAACRAGEPDPAQSLVKRKTPGRTFDGLCERYYRTPRWLGMATNSRATYRGIIERYRDRLTGKGQRVGAAPVQWFSAAKIDRHLGAMANTPAAANNLRKVLKRLFAYAVKIGWRADNPADLTDGYRAGPGWHTWTDDEIEQYRAHHPYGTRARLTLELALNTAARRCNVAQLQRSQLRRGKFHIAHVKGCDETIVAASPESLTAIEAMPVAGIGHFIVTEFGKPFTVPGLGNKFREWCDQAGLPQCSMHGLRKAQSRRLAEAGATDAQGRAVTGHKKDRMFAYYAERANREGLADTALANLEARKLANHEKGE